MEGGRYHRDFHLIWLYFCHQICPCHCVLFILRKPPLSEYPLFEGWGAAIETANGIVTLLRILGPYWYDIRLNHHIRSLL